MADNLLAKLFVEIGANLDPAKGQINGFKGFLLNSFKGLGSSITAALGPVGAAIAGAFAIKEMADAFMEGELAATALASALDSNGHAVDENIAKFEDFAAAVQSATRLDDEAVFGLLTKGINLGLPTDSVDQFAKAAIGLGQAIGIGPEEAMKALAKEAQGVKSNLDRSIPALKGVTDQAQRMAIISEFAGKGLAQEEAAAQTLSGQITQLWNEIGNLAETLGGFLAPVIGFGVQLLKDLTGIIQGVADAFSDCAVDTADLGELLRGYMLQNFYMIAEVLKVIAPVAVNVFGTLVGWMNQAAGAALDLWNKVSTFGVRLPEMFQTWLDAAGRVFGGIAEYLGIAAGDFTTFVTSSIDTIAGWAEQFAFYVLNLDLVFQEASIFIQDWVAGVRDRFTYALEVVGAFADWMSSNFVGIFTNVLGNSIQILMNWADNLGSIFSEAINYIKSLGKDAFEPTLKAWDEGTKKMTTPLKMPKFKDSFDAEGARAGLDKLWGERKKEWDAIQREDPLDPTLGSVDLPIVKAMAEEEKKKKKAKESGDTAGTFSKLGTAWQTANSMAQKAVEKREEEKLKEAKKTNQLLESIDDSLDDLNLGVE